LGLLSGADQEGEAAGWGNQGGCGWQDGFEAFDGPEGDYVEGGGEGLGAVGLYIDARQCKSAGDFAKEGGLLVVGLDQREGEVRVPEFEGETGESGAGAYVGDCKTLHHRGHGGRRREKIAGGEEALAEVAGYDFFGVADGGEVDAGIPAEEYIDVRRYTMQLGGGQDCRFLSGFRRFGMTTALRDCDWGAEEGVEQLGDAGRVHRGKRVPSIEYRVPSAECRVKIVDGLWENWGNGCPWGRLGLDPLECQNGNGFKKAGVPGTGSGIKF